MGWSLAVDPILFVLLPVALGNLAANLLWGRLHPGR